MLVDEPFRYQITDFDLEVFSRLVPVDDPLVLAEQEIDWEAFRDILTPYYCSDRGQPAIDPLRMLKLEFLKYRHNLSDQQVIARTQTDLSFRYFLQVGYTFQTPDPSSLCRFRARLGEEGFSQVFDALVGQARETGLVKDRLRLKDASHVVASIAVRNTLALVAQVRDRLLKTAEPFDAEYVAGQRIEVDQLRQRTKEQQDESRLSARVTHLQELVAWGKGQSASSDLPSQLALANAWEKFQQTLTLAEKILQDREPKATRKTLSIHDTEARRGKHGEYYDGYMVDILMDADSEIITQMSTLEAGGDEAKDAAHGNSIESLSIDGAGFNGEMLQTLEGPADSTSEPSEGLDVKVFVPPKSEPSSDRFTGSDFTANEDGSSVTCPQGETSQYRQRDPKRNATIYRFTRVQCDACSLVRQCENPHPTIDDGNGRQCETHGDFVRGGACGCRRIAPSKTQLRKFRLFGGRGHSVEKRNSKSTQRYGGQMKKSPPDAISNV